jgi:hypothetical protein
MGSAGSEPSPVPAPPRHVFVGLTEVAGYYRGLVKGLREHGIRVTYADLSGNPYEFAEAIDKPRWIAAIERLLGRIRGGHPIGITPRKVAWAAARSVLKVPIALWALARCDVFIFGFRTHFLFHHELKLLRFLGKTSVFIFHGTDSRPPYLSGRHVPQSGPIDGRMLARRTRRMKAAVNRIDRSADIVVVHPPSAHLHDRLIVPWLWLGIPDRLPPVPAPPPPNDVPFRIVHAPTSPASKGTPIIRAAIEELRAGGYTIDYRELVGRPNREVLQAISRAHVVVDQVYSDTPMAGLATEAASIGRAAVVGGYDLPLVVAQAPADRVPPTRICHPDDLIATIAALIDDRPVCTTLGVEAHTFVSGNWTAEVVAGRLLQLIGGDSPAAALQPAHPNPYVHGWGLPESRVRAAIRAVVASGGTDALCISNETTRETLLAFGGVSEAAK